MARIKVVINERRIAYEGAVEQFAQDKELGKLGAVAAAKKQPTKAKQSSASATKGRLTVARRKARSKSKAAETPAAVTPAPALPLTA